MIETETIDWHQANQLYLVAALGELRQTIESHFGVHPKDGNLEGSSLPPVESADQLRSKMLETPALDRLCEIFGLSAFERDVLLTCAGVELDAGIAGLFAQGQGGPSEPRLNFGCLMSCLDEAHWSAIAPSGPLRYRRLIEFGNGDGPTSSTLRIEERVLHYLTGVDSQDERLSAYVAPVPVPNKLVPSHLAISEQIAETWSDPQERPAPLMLQLCGEDTADRWDIVATACQILGLGLNVMLDDVVPTEPRDMDTLMRLLQREAALSNCALLLDCAYSDSEKDPARSRAVSRFIEGIGGPVILGSREPRQDLRRLTIDIDVKRPTPGEQTELWRSCLGTAFTTGNGRVGHFVSQFNFNASTIRAIAATARHRTRADDELTSSELEDVLWDACCRQRHSRLGGLSQLIEPMAEMEDLVIPDAQRQTLGEIATNLRHQRTVYETWGFSGKSSRGLGITACLRRPSGTGKTMAAEVLAKELRLSLYRIDLATVVSKFIGETEKNLKSIFDAADEGGAILLFDEADALFGKRSEVKDSHDRYANIEVSYLLQRMETYRGLAILTTNMKSALDQAFLRRIRFVVRFPFPNADQRENIWRRIFPAATPTEDLDTVALGRLNVAGGNIRNIAMNAAFLAADDETPVRMKHLLAAARSEYSKLEKTLTDAEIRGWV